MARSVLRAPIHGGRITECGFELESGGAQPGKISHVSHQCGWAGRGIAVAQASWTVAHTVPPIHLAKGVYFTLRGRTPFRHLVYPLPDALTLGIHVTLDLAGRARFGPDLEWVERIDYDVDPRRAPLFATAIRRYWPDLPDEALEPGYAGIRPKFKDRANLRAISSSKARASTASPASLRSTALNRPA